jgi:primosomal protein N'
LSGNILDFYAKEMEDRRALGYPPFGTFIKVTARGAKNFVIKETENLKNLLKEYDPIIFSSVQEKKGEQSAVNGIIKLRKENWPDNDILSILKSIPPHFEIKVDPDNLL